MFETEVDIKIRKTGLTGSSVLAFTPSVLVEDCLVSARDGWLPGASKTTGGLLPELPDLDLLGRLLGWLDDVDLDGLDAWPDQLDCVLRNGLESSEGLILMLHCAVQVLEDRLEDLDLARLLRHVVAFYILVRVQDGLPRARLPRRNPLEVLDRALGQAPVANARMRINQQLWPLLLQHVLQIDEAPGQLVGQLLVARLGVNGRREVVGSVSGRQVPVDLGESFRCWQLQLGRPVLFLIL